MVKTAEYRDGKLLGYEWDDPVDFISEWSDMTKEQNR